MIVVVSLERPAYVANLRKRRKDISMLRKSTTIIIAAVAVISSLPTLALAQKPAPSLPTVKLCTGARDGNYDFSGIQIAQQAKGALDVVVVNTQGSLDNLAKLDKGECDAAIVQSDAYGVYLKQNARSALNLEKGRVLYQEYLHFICNRDARLSKITQLSKANTILVGPHRSPHFEAGIAVMNIPVFAKASANFSISGRRRCSGMFGMRS